MHVLTLASYNIHIGIGQDGRFNPNRVADVVNELDADVIALQEIQLGAGTFDMLAHLRSATGLAAIAGPTLVHPKLGHYGNAVLSRLPLIEHRSLDLTFGTHEPRGAIHATFEWGAEKLGVLATHLGLRPIERRAQVRWLLRELSTYGNDIPVVLLGDMNEWFLWGRPLRWLRTYFGKSLAPPTFPSGWPFLALDRIWVKPSRRLRTLRVHGTALARQASDHLPVIATLHPC